jgi:hypothetical protein
MVNPRLLLLAFFVFVLVSPEAHARDYKFDGKVSRPVLENYLSRSITMLDLLTGKGDVDDNIRMLRNTGAKFAGRSIYLWGGERQLPAKLAAARQNARKTHTADPEMILQACVFEIVSKDVEKLPVPAWAFEAFGQSPEQRNFRYEAMLYPNGRGRDHWQNGASIPDISQQEAKLWFYFLAASYIDVGCEAIHFGQTEIMDGNDSDHRHWWELLQKVRLYAVRHARRHWVLCDAHVPSGGMLHGERLLFDFHSFPLRIVEVPDRPQEGVLKMGAFDSIYGRSVGGIAPSGWRCEHLPYLVELDNWGVSNRPGPASRMSVAAGCGAMTKSLGLRTRMKRTEIDGSVMLGTGCENKIRTASFRCPAAEFFMLRWTASRGIMATIEARWSRKDSARKRQFKRFGRRIRSNEECCIFTRHRCGSIECHIG